MGGGFDVDIDSLSTSGTHVGHVGDALTEAAAAAASAQAMTEDAFGILCSFLAPPANSVQQIGTGLLQAMAGVVNGTADATSACIETYETTEGDRTAALRALQECLA